jgi:hypothetical protein
MSKKIQTDEIANELANGSLFFGRNARPVTSDRDETQGTTPPGRPVSRRTARTVASSPASTPASTSDSSQASSVASNPDSSAASFPASTTDSEQARTQARKRASTIDRTQADSLASTLASSTDLVDAIYRVVKKPGKQTAYVRVTEREKSEFAAILADITERYGYKVTETELIRTAICSALADYAENGMESLLMRVIVALRD